MDAGSIFSPTCNTHLGSAGCVLHCRWASGLNYVPTSRIGSEPTSMEYLCSFLSTITIDFLAVFCLHIQSGHNQQIMSSNAEFHQDIFLLRNQYFVELLGVTGVQQIRSHKWDSLLCLSFLWNTYLGNSLFTTLVILNWSEMSLLVCPSSCKSLRSHSCVKGPFLHLPRFQT